MDIGIVILIVTILGMCLFAYYIFRSNTPSTPEQQAYIAAYRRQKSIEDNQSNIEKQNNSDEAAARIAATAAILPRQQIGALGADDIPGHLIRGWYDIQKQGADNDYCAYFNTPSVWYCALAGSKDFATASEYNTPAKRVPMPVK